MSKIKIIISWFLVIIWMIIIFLLSNMDTFESNSKSKNVINKVIETTVDTTNKIGITNDHLSEQKKQEVTNDLNKPIRKLMHGSVYLILTILLMNALIVSNIKFSKVIILSIIISFIYAYSDEYHQTFINGRTGKLSDVLIDTCGSILGLSLYSLGYFVYQKKNNK